MRFPDINPTAFEIFGLEIKWYGISYALGLILALFLCKILSKKYNKVKEKIFDDILIWVALGMMRTFCGVLHLMILVYSIIFLKVYLQMFFQTV